MQQSYLNISQITSVIFLLLSGLLLYALMRRHYTYAGMVALVILIKVVISRNRVEVIPCLPVCWAIILSSVGASPSRW